MYVAVFVTLVYLGCCILKTCTYCIEWSVNGGWSVCVCIELIVRNIVLRCVLWRGYLKIKS